MRLATKVIGLTTGATLLLVGGVFYFASNKIEQTMLVQIEQQRSSTLASVRDQITQSQTHIRETGEFLVGNENISKALDLDISRGISARLNHIVGIYPNFSYILIVESNGNVFAVNTKDHEDQRFPGEQMLGLNVNNHPLMPRATLDNIISITNGSPGKDPWARLVGGQDGRLQWYVVPIKKRGHTLGYMVLAYNWGEEIDALKKLIVDELAGAGNPTLDVILVDANTTVVGESQLGLRQFSPTADWLWAGQQIIFGDQNLQLIVIDDYAKATQSLRQIRGDLLLVVGIFFGFMFVSLWYLMKWILIDRLNILHRGSTELGRGNWSNRLPSLGSDEIGELGAVFNDMANSLERAFNDLNQQQEVLETRVLERTEDLNRSNAELEQFAFVASHDLKEPLRTINSFLGLLERSCADKLDEKEREFINFAVDGSTRMNNLISGLLSLSQLGTSKQLITSVDSGQILASTLADLEVVIKDSGALIHHDKMPLVLADENHLHQLFQNLISNAIKYCDDSHPSINIGVEYIDDKWQFSMADNGIGMDAKNIGRIFKIFQRLHGRGEYSGVGIGLAMCKKIVERHGGRIWVESEVGVGSTFFFTLPDAIEAAPTGLSAMG